MKYPKFVIRKSSNDQFYFNLWSAQEEILLTSEMYTAKQSCKNGIESVKTNAPNDKNYYKQISQNGKYYFVLKSGNGEIIGVSRMYTDSSDRDNSIAKVKRDAPIAETEELS
ncbi:MAG: YegP family protein [Flavobacterium sp. JAD_PAG50586_2]|nr:MAG: YegP family protein [Flavobacterium sp. JAD_PAG50586_2]